MRTLAVILLLTTSALALPLCHKKPKGPKPPPKPPAPHVSTVSTSSSTATASASSTSSSTANQTQGQSMSTTYEAPKIPVSTAFAPTMVPTVPCFKGASAGVQTMAIGASVGAGKIDENCAALETARSFAEAGKLLAYCKVMVTTKAAKVAGVTLEDCMSQPEPEEYHKNVILETPAPTLPAVVVRDLPTFPTVIFGPPQVITVEGNVPKKKVPAHRRRVRKPGTACEVRSSLSCGGL